MTSRRGFLGAIAAALVLDPERALWVPGRKHISIPAPVFLAVGDIVQLAPFTERYIVTTEARSIARIGDARFRVHDAYSDCFLQREGLYCSHWPPGTGALKPTIIRSP